MGMIVVSFFLIIPYQSISQISKHLTYTVDDLDRTTQSNQGHNFEKVKMKMAFQSDNVGNPELPVYYYKFYVPKGKTVTGVVFKGESTKELQLNSDLVPAQHPIPISQMGIDTTFDAPDPIIYGKDAFYPEAQAIVLNSDFVDGDMEVVTVAFYPIQYNPKQRKIKMATDGLLNLTTVATGTSMNPASFNRFDGHNHGQVMTDIMKSMVENPEDVPAAFNIVESPEIPSDLKSAQITWSVPFYEYVVVTTRALKPAFKQFISWKKRKGYNAGVVCIEDIVADPAAVGDPLSSTLTDDAGKLRQYLMAGYNNSSPKTQYVLLGGDYSTGVPIRYGFGGDFPNSNLYWENEGSHIPSDLYFSDFNTNWTYVSTVKTGTSYSGFDYGPEIFVGRLMCNSESDIQTWTSKVLLYEQNPGNGDYSYLSKSLFTEADGLGTISTSILPAIFTTRNLWQELSSDYVGTSTEPHFPKGADVISELNTHYGFYSAFNHGSTNSFATATYMENGYGTDYGQPLQRYQVTSSDSYIDDHNISVENGNGMNNLTNLNYPTILYSICCLTMPFDAIQIPGTRNVGVSFTVAYSGGGPAYIGNTRDGWSYIANTLENYFFSNITSFPQLGIAEARSKIGFGSSGTTHFTCLTHNLIGCPETPMWTVTPTLFSGSVSENGTSVTVNTGGVIADKICVMSALNDGYFQVQPNVSSFTFSGVSKPYYVTITKANYIPFRNALTNVLIENKTLSSDCYLDCQTLSAGFSVDPNNSPDGNVVIANGANVTFDATGDIILASGFEVQLGATFEAK